MSSYIYTLTAGALVVSILVTLAGSGSMGKLVKLLAGVFMALTVIAPLLKLELPDPEDWMSKLESDGRSAVAAGEEMADEAYRAIIKERMEAYILDKAARYQAAVTVNVVLDQAGVPAAVEISGAVSPYVRAKLAQELHAELGLGEEVQRWTG